MVMSVLLRSVRCLFGCIAWLLCLSSSSSSGRSRRRRNSRLMLVLMLTSILLMLLLLILLRIARTETLVAWLHRMLLVLVLALLIVIMFSLAFPLSTTVLTLLSVDFHPLPFVLKVTVIRPCPLSILRPLTLSVPIIISRASSMSVTMRHWSWNSWRKAALRRIWSWLEELC